MLLRHIRNWFGQSLIGHLFDGGDGAAGNGGDGGGAGAGAGSGGQGSGAGAAGAGAAGSGAGAAGAGAAGAASGGGAAGAGAGAAGSGAGGGRQPQSFSYREDRSKWLPPHRLKEETDRRDTMIAKMQADLDAANKRVQALAGVNGPTPDEAEAQKIREAFYALPGMAHFRELTPEAVKDLLELRQARTSLDNTVKHHWDTLARNTYRTLEERFLDQTGIEELTERQQHKLRSGFAAWLRANEDEEGKMSRRYDAGDPTLVDDYLKELIEDLGVQVGRAKVAQAAGGGNPRPPLPRSGSSAPVRTQPPAINYADPDAVENEAIRRLKEAGVMTNA